MLTVAQQTYLNYEGNIDGARVKLAWMREVCKKPSRVNKVNAGWYGIRIGLTWVINGLPTGAYVDEWKQQANK